MTKERIKDNINNNGHYTCMSCALKKSHQNNPRNEETSNKISRALLGIKRSDETKLKMSQSAHNKWETEWGKNHKIKLAKLAAIQNSNNNNMPNKSKRKIFYISAKNNNEIRSCLSSYEYIYCENFLEKDENVESYLTQVYYEAEGSARSLDFLITYKNKTKKVVEIKPKKRLGEEYHLKQIEDSKKNAETNGWEFSVLTEENLGILKSSDATKLADQYRDKHYDMNLAEYRKEKDRKKANLHYKEKIATNKIKLFCEFCQTEHEALKLTHDKNIARNGRYICEKEGGKIAGSRPKKKKDNPYALEGKKQCNECLNILPFNMFGTDKYKSDGYATRCKKCRNETK